MPESRARTKAEPVRPTPTTNSRTTPAPAPTRRPSPVRPRLPAPLKPTRAESGAVAPQFAKPMPTGAPAPAPNLHHLLGGRGRPIDPHTRELLAHRFGRPLDSVRIHDDAAAAAAARRAGSLAFTVGDDIVFGAGQHRPHSRSGLELLAHEVAHTVQQRGSGQLAPLHRLAASAPSSTLEREADAAARSVVSGPPVAGGASDLLHARASGPTLSRKAFDWTPIPGGPVSVGGQTISSWQKESTTEAWFKVPEFELPAEKGAAAKDLYEEVASHGRSGQSGLAAEVEVDGQGLEAIRKLDRASNLNSRWMTRVGWTNDNADDSWAAAGGAKVARGGGFPSSNPGARGSTVACDMDHVVELQLGGGQHIENIAPLDPSDNRASGALIAAQISRLVNALRPKLAKQGPVRVLLSFQSVKQAKVAAGKACAKAKGTAACTCADVAQCALEQKGSTEPDEGLVSYKVEAAGQTTEFMVPAKIDEDFDLRSSARSAAAKQNRANSELIPGLLLYKLQRTPKRHVFLAYIEDGTHKKDRGDTKVPISVTGFKGRGKKGPTEAELLELEATPAKAAKDDTRTLKLVGQPEVAFYYPKLSEGSLRLALGSDGLSGTGTLEPSTPMLKQSPIAVQLKGGEFSNTKDPEASKIGRQIPSFKVTRSALHVALAPELAVSGDLDFEVGRILTGKNFKAEASSAGLALSGALEAKIPKLQGAKGEVSYRDNEFTGSLTITSDQFKNLPGKPEGEVTVRLGNKGLSADGKVTLTLPGGNPLTLDAKPGEHGGIAFAGSGSVAIPGLHPLLLNASWDGEHFAAQGSTGITYKNLQGDITVKYHDGKFSGDVVAGLKAGRVEGTVHVFLDDDASLYGEGKVRVQITKDLAGTIGVKKPKHGDIEVFGQLELPPKIELFPGKHVDKSLFDQVFNIPVFGPVALQINPSIGFGAGIGPATIDDAKVSAGFKPFAADADFALDASAQLSIPAYAQLSVAVGLGVALTAGVGSIGGGVNVSGTLRLDGGIFVPFELHYKDGIFTAHATVEVKGDLSVLVAIKGYLLAEALNLELWHPVWNLWDKKFDTGLGFKLTIPLDYASNKPFELPSRDQMTFEPNLSLANAKKALLDAVGPLH